MTTWILLIIVVSVTVSLAAQALAWRKRRLVARELKTVPDQIPAALRYWYEPDHEWLPAPHIEAKASYTLEEIDALIGYPDAYYERYTDQLLAQTFVLLEEDISVSEAKRALVPITSVRVQIAVLLLAHAYPERSLVDWVTIAQRDMRNVLMYFPLYRPKTRRRAPTEQ